jgi:uroporphyrinogen-III decarboxylase
MVRESMTPDERLWAAIRLEHPDRVPVIPTLLPEPAAGLAGLTLAQVAEDNQLAVDAVFRVFDAYGGWDNPYPAAYAPVQLQASGVYPMKMRIPGVDLGEDDEFQLLEEEVLQPGDYGAICEMGMERFYYEDYLWRVTVVECSKRNLRPFFMGSTLHPFFTLSLMRSMVPFTKDLHYAPEPVERALRRMTADLIPRQIELVKKSGIDICMLTEERASAFFYPPAVFERFWWPYTREIVDAFWAEGIVTLFHLDQCWDQNLAYFEDLPRGSAILELDGATDIFAAKQILGDRLCLKGDVPAARLVLGEPQEVVAYCRKLIDEVGDGGGFILGSGCSVPPNVKAENFRAMIETGTGRAPSRA